MTDWRDVEVRVCSKCGQHHYGQGVAHNFPEDSTECKRCVGKGNWARSVLSRAIGSGKVERPEACEECGHKPEPAADGRSRIEAHHHSYTKPFDVTFLCPQCLEAADEEPAGVEG